jgi:glycosyltransferase involved in cell wall biosynthesis
MALGTPVVSTTLGAAGIDVRDGETALVADDPAEFAERVVRLLKEPGLRQKIAANARLHVARNFGWDRSVRALNTVLEKVTG